jgi:hypothetical protein
VQGLAGKVGGCPVGRREKQKTPPLHPPPPFGDAEPARPRETKPATPPEKPKRKKKKKPEEEEEKKTKKKKKKKKRHQVRKWIDQN